MAVVVSRRIVAVSWLRWVTKSRRFSGVSFLTPRAAFPD